MQPYNYRTGVNTYYNNGSGGRPVGYENQNDRNKPMNSPFAVNNNATNPNADVTNTNFPGNEMPYNPNYYYGNQNQGRNQAPMVPPPPMMRQSPPPPPATPFTPMYPQSPPPMQNNLNYPDSASVTTNITAPVGGVMQDEYQAGHGVAYQSDIPNSKIHSHVMPPSNNLKQPINFMAYDNINAMNNVQQTTTTESYEELFQFNAFPHFVKSSVNFMPANSTLKQKAHVPLGFVIHPLAPIPEGYPELSSVNFGNSSVVRCKKCRTYINPFVKFDCGGKKWNCNMCYHINDTPQFYYKPLDEKGKRKDLFERPELCTGSVEFIAPSDYMIRPPQPPVYLFLIDVCVNSVNSGLLDIICSTIKKLLPKNNDGNAVDGGRNISNQTFGPRTLIGIITFDSTIHFYNLNANLKQTQMMVVPDLSDIFIPLPEDILVNAHESQNSLDMLLDNLPIMWRNNKITDCCAGNAIKAAFMVLKKIGGKILLFLSSAPNIGELTVSPIRETKPVSKSKYKHIYGSNNVNLKNNSVVDVKQREMEMLNPLNNSYAELAQTITQYQISVDLFACPAQQQLDLATIYPLIKNSGGTLYYYPQFNVHQYSEKLREELLFALTAETAWESVMRIRISKGWKISNWYGNFQFRGVDLLALPNCHSGQAVSIIVNLEENVVQDSVVYVQSALLYTNSNGERRIRLHTYALPVTQNIKTITDSINPAVVVSLLSHQAIEISKKGKIADGRNLIQTLCSQVLSSQIILSENAKMLSIYILGMLKSVAFRDSGDVPSDVRIYHWHRIENIAVAAREAYFYPRMYSLHNLERHHGNYDENSNIILPESLNLTCENMSQDGCYLLEDGESLMMWIGRGINAQWIYAVFGVQSLDQLNSDYAENHLCSTGSPIGIQILNIITGIRKLITPPYMRLIVIKQGDPIEHKFFASLIEDRSQHMMLSLKEFLGKICMKKKDKT